MVSQLVEKVGMVSQLVEKVGVVSQLVEKVGRVSQLVETGKMVGKLVETRGPHTQPTRLHQGHKSCIAPEQPFSGIGSIHLQWSR